MNTDVTMQTFWSRYKVIISGALMSVLTALSPLITAPRDQWDYKALVVAAMIAVATFLGKEARGKNWTVLGQVAAAMLAIASGIEGHFDVVRIIVAGAFAFFSIPIPPIKLSTYESTDTILEAKEEAIEIKQQRDVAAKNSTP